MKRLFALLLQITRSARRQKCLPHLAVIVGLAVVDKSAEIAARLNVSLNAFNMDDSEIFTSTLW